MASKAKGKRTPYLLRMPPELHKKLTGVAREERRTINEQIVYVLETWLAKRSKD